jgi:release factor glutamine methyltransferase
LETVAQAIRRVQLELQGATDSPRLDAELLIAHVLSKSRSDVLASFPDELTPPQQTGLAALVERRAAGEPIAYIVGYREFYGHQLVVSPAVLTPRPETELLVEWALGWLVSSPDATVVDVGTGSGAIAVSVALATPPDIRVLAVDISLEALNVARDNARFLGADRVEFLPGDLLESVNPPVDLVLANLPYLRADQIDSNRDLSAEPRLALDGGDRGLELIRRLIEQLSARLAANGAAGLEIDPSQSGAVADLLQTALPDARVAIHQDLAGLDRIVTAVRQS